MKLLQKLMFSLALTLAACGVATAASTTDVPLDAAAPGVFTNTWTIGSSVAGTTHGYADSDFSNNYRFNVLEDEAVTFSLSSVNGGVDLSSDVYTLSYIDGTLLQYGYGSKTSSFGDFGVLTNGVYVLTIRGTYLANGGTYTGAITGNILAAVPEPSTWMMMLAGMTLLAATTRARKNRV